jgi:hypothetical protein
VIPTYRPIRSVAIAQLAHRLNPIPNQANSNSADQSISRSIEAARRTDRINQLRN